MALAVMVAQIVVMSVMNGFRAELLDRMLGFNGHAYVSGAC
jgi:lipoprotein-releasing system permease protein